MARPTLPSGTEIEYDTFGDPSDPELLFVIDCPTTSCLPVRRTLTRVGGWR